MEGEEMSGEMTDPNQAIYEALLKIGIELEKLNKVVKKLADKAIDHINEPQ